MYVFRHIYIYRYIHIRNIYTETWTTRAPPPALPAASSDGSRSIVSRKCARWFTCTLSCSARDRPRDPKMLSKVNQND